MKKYAVSAVVVLLAAGTSFAGPKIDTGANRVRTGLKLDMKRIGTIQPKSANELGDGGWMIGCECLDRDYANFDEYKEYLQPLGIKKIRIQSGWAKCEKEKGVYDFSWLDTTVDWANANGFTPMLSVGYGNPIYSDAKAHGALSMFPVEGEYLEAWKKWLDALAKHFAGRITLWETWNEAGNIPGVTPKMLADNNILTAEIIRRHNPNAKVTGIVLGWLNDFEAILKELKATGKSELLSSVSVHLYYVNPEQKADDLDAKLKQVAEHLPHAKLIMSESGAPSEMLPSHGYARWPFTEVSQAKLMLRRMLIDHSRNVDSSIFSISDMHYDKGLESIPFNNAKGILAANSAREIIRIKRAYYSAQNIVTFFDDTVKVVPKAERRFVNNDETIWFDEYRSAGGHSVIAFWQWQKRDHAFDYKADRFRRVATYPMPSESFETRTFTFGATGKAFKRPVLIDMFSGRVYEFPMEDQIVHSRGIVYADVPVYDSPFVITEFDALEGKFTPYAE